MQTFDYRQNKSFHERNSEEGHGSDVDIDVDAELGNRKGITNQTPSTPEGWHKKFASEDSYFRGLKF